MGHALQHGPDHLRPARAAGQPEQRPPGAEVPRRRGHAEQGGHEPDVARGGACRGDGLGRGRVVDDAEVVAQPLDRLAGGEHERLDAPGDPSVAAPGRDGERPVRPALGELGPDRADAHVEHPARAEGHLGQTRPGAALADERRLLVAGDPGDRRRAGQGARRADRPPEESTMRGSTDHGMRRASSTASSHPEPSSSIIPVTPALERSVTWSVPAESVQATHVSTVPKHRSRVRSGSAASSRTASLVADAAGRQPQPLGLEGQAHHHRALVLPADPGADRLARLPVPDDGGRPLGGDPDGVDLVRRRPAPPAPPPEPRRPARRRRTRRSRRPGRWPEGTGAGGVSGDGGVGGDDRRPHAARAHVDDQQAHADRPRRADSHVAPDDAGRGRPSMR